MSLVIVDTGSGWSITTGSGSATPPAFYSSGVPSGNANSMRLAVGPTAGNVISDTTSDSLICISGADASAPNQIIGTANLRGIWGGYDNCVDGTIASNIFGSHHSMIDKSTGGHMGIFGGAYGRTLSGVNSTQYAAILGGQFNTVGGGAAGIVTSDFCLAYGQRALVAGSIRSSVGVGLGTGVAHTGSAISNPQAGSVLTLSSTATFGSPGDTGVTVAMDSVSVGGFTRKVFFTVTVTDSTHLTITSNSPVSYSGGSVNKPNITNGANVYPTIALASNGNESMILASSDSEISANNASASNNVIIGCAGAFIQLGTAHAAGTQYPSFSLVMAGDGVSNAAGQIIRGLGARGLNPGEQIDAFGNFSVAGDSQIRRVNFIAATTDATATGTAVRYGKTATPGQNFVLPPNKTFLLTAKIVAAQTGGAAGTVGDSGTWTLECMVKTSSVGAITLNGAGSNISGTVVFRDTAPASDGWTCALKKFDAASLGGAYASNNQGLLQILCTGAASKNIRWMGFCQFVEVAYA